MRSLDRQGSALRPMAWVCVVLVLLITLLSAYMRLDKAGIGCQPWPQCHAQSASTAAASAAPAEGGPTPAIVAARLAHRVAAVAVLLLVLAMAATSLGTRPRWRLETAEVLALLATTLFLAVLGVWTAQSRLPAVALGNLLGGFLMLALGLRLATRRPTAAPARWRAWIWITAALVLLQVALGGMASTTGSILSCSGLADCWSAAQSSSWSALDPWRVPALPGDGAGVSGAPVQLAHRLGALAVLLCGLPLALRMRRHDRGALPLLVCLLAQAVLGPSLVALGFPMALVLLHNLLAALTLALLARWL